MSKQMTAVAFLALVAGTAMAAPRESLPGPASVNVNGASQASVTFNLNFTGNNPGPYMATHVLIAGTLTSNAVGTWPADTSMDITPPGGAAVTVVLSAVTGGYVTQAINANANLGGPVSPAGSWLFDTYDTFEDGDGLSPESIFTDIVITLDDTPGSANASQATAVDLGTLVDGTNVSTPVAVGGGEVLWYKFTTLDCSAGAGRKLSVGTLNSVSADDSEIALYVADGTAGWTNDDFGAGAFSFLSFGVGSTIGVDLPAGLKYLAVGSFNTNFFLNFIVNSDGPGGSFQLDVLQEFLGAPTAPVSEDLGTLVDGTNVSRTGTLAATEVKWYKATVGAANGTTGRTLSISTLNTVDATDTEIGLYSTTGVLLGNNDDNPFPRSLMTFGSSGTLGDVAAGLVYIPVSTYNANFLGSGWNVNSTGAGGNYQLDVIQTVAAPAIVWDEAINGGGDAGNTPATAQAVTGTGRLDRITGTFSGTDFDVFKINICDAAAFTATTQFSANNPDTQLFLFDSAGMAVEFNDDANGIGYSTIDGSLVTGTGTYLLCVSRYDNDPVDSAGNEFWIDAPFAGVRAPDGPGVGNVLAGNDGANAAAGTYRIDMTGVCYFSGNTACSIADVGIAGGFPGQDHILDNNDFIAFITFFFAQNPIADMGIAGGFPGSDSTWDNNDFIAFINHFFDDVVACNG